MKSKTGVKAWLLYALVRVALCVVQMFPIEWNLRTARLIARIWIRVMPRHLERAIAGLKHAYGKEYSDEKIKEIAEKSLENVAMFAIEAVCIPRMITTSTWPRYIQLRQVDELMRMLLSNRGAILITGHYGSFEIMGHLLAAVGYSMVSVMRPIDNYLLNNFLVRTREIRGMKLLNKKGASAEVATLLEEGSLVGFVADQDAGRKGVFVDFFGQPASTYKSIGLLAMSTNRPIAVGYGRRRGNHAKYEVGVARIIMPEEWRDKPDPLRWITQAYTSALEEVIREEPTQYWWLHRRWKSKPRVRAAKSSQENI